jgi:hypothetical protein
MATLKYILLFSFAAVFSVAAQMHTWPPGGYTASTELSSFKLPESRFVPSSSRYNLVWADQIVPQWITPGKVEFAALNYIGTQKIFSYQAEQFRKFNPNFLIVIYHLAAGLNPAQNKDCPDPKSQSGDNFIGVVAPKGFVSEYKEYLLPWLMNSADIQVGSDRFESMFQHYDSMSPNHRVWHNDPYWLMNMENTDWIDYLASACLDWMEGNQNEGCFFDVSVETNVSLYNPKISNPAPGNFDWWSPPHFPYGYENTTPDRNKFAIWMNNNFRNYYRKIYKKFHTSNVDYLVLPNVDQMVTTIYDPVWMDDVNGEKTIDGAMVENFGSYTGQDMYLTLERSFRHITNPGKIMIAQFGATTSSERIRRTGMYMLIKNRNSFINIINTGQVEWYPEYEIDLGDQMLLPANFNDLRIAGSGWGSLWKRDYEKGIVLCNTSNSVINYDLTDQGWRKIVTSGGGDVSAEGKIAQQDIQFIDIGKSIAVNPSECTILLKPEKPDWVPGAESWISQPSISPNPFSETTTITYYLEAPSYIELKVYNSIGEEVALLLSDYQDRGSHSVILDGNNLSTGIYFYRMVSDDQIRTGYAVLNK